MRTNRQWFVKRMQDGLPIALGYLAVSFTLGIAAKNAGFTALQAMIASLTNNASAGEFVGFTLFASGAGYLELALMELIANARYLLMSCALSQKLSPDTPLHHRLLLGFYLTDEFFGLSVSVPKTLNPFYTYGMISLGAPAWAFGTYFGCLMGNVLPVNIVNALSVSLYAMFLAIIVPPARKNKTLLVLIIISMLASYLFGILPIVSEISSGVRIILLTILLSGAAAILFPIKEDVTNES